MHQKYCNNKQLTSSTNSLILSVNWLMRFSRAVICGVVGIYKNHKITRSHTHDTKALNDYGLYAVDYVYSLTCSEDVIQWQYCQMLKKIKTNIHKRNVKYQIKHSYKT